MNLKELISTKEALRKLSLAINSKVTNAAILVFGKDTQKFFIQSEVRCARFKGKKSVKPFIDMKVLKGNIYEQKTQKNNK